MLPVVCFNDWCGVRMFMGRLRGEETSRTHDTLAYQRRALERGIRFYELPRTCGRAADDVVQVGLLLTGVQLIWQGIAAH